MRRNLHVVLCFSPVGDKFRIRARQFPALINCVAIDWFHTWPSEVPRRLLSSLPTLSAALRCLLGKLLAKSRKHEAIIHITCRPW